MTRHLFPLLLLLSTTSTAIAAVNGPICLSLYQSKKYKQSATCFERWGQTMLLKQGQSKGQLDVIRGRAFSNGAAAYHKAAQQETKTERKGYLLHRGVLLLKLYLKHKYYEAPAQMKRAQLRMLQMETTLGASTLSIVAGRKNTKIIVTGYRFRHIGMGTWNRKVRPGRYKIEVHYPNKSLVRRVSVRRNKAKIETFQPPKQARSIPPRPRPLPQPAPRRGPHMGSLILLATGGALLLTGSIIAGVGAAADGEKQQLYAAALAQRTANQKLSPEITDAITAQHNKAATLIPAGWVILSVGMAAGGAGAILFFLTRPQATKPTPPTTPAKGKHQLMHTPLLNAAH